ncbi:MULTISPECIES: hypothetical protein [Pseudomonas]|jgi:hypothetical protein|uniref:Uncharacterized protein n=1 Tax=Pseudomonas gingeri TaxID=117681 RepID=A0A7Y7WDB1_9PSED|nr:MULTISPECIES: hypothetical protein [Pseudomonas]MCU1738461.1 hypothetical protein [Pseudomonas sp. 20S_6.2_Bac1]NWB46524.1 hypothetical protein [Pseudomonas gingeri]
MDEFLVRRGAVCHQGKLDGFAGLQIKSCACSLIIVLKQSVISVFSKFSRFKGRFFRKSAQGVAQA